MSAEAFGDELFNWLAFLVAFLSLLVIGGAIEEGVRWFQRRRKTKCG